jgi:hypothetical protein
MQFNKVISGFHSGSSGGVDFSTIDTDSPLTGDSVTGGIITQPTGTIGIQQASSSQDGFITPTDISSFQSNEFLFGYQLLGGLFKSQLLSNISPCTNITQNALTSGQMQLNAIYLPTTTTITGFVYFAQNKPTIVSNGNFNGMALYSFDGVNTLTRVAITTDDVNNFNGATVTTWRNIAFTSPQTLNSGLYWVAYLVNFSSGTAPIIISSVNNRNIANASVYNTTTWLSAQTGAVTMSSTLPMSLLSGTISNYMTFLY